MLVEIRVPLLAESVAEATLMDWHKQPGDAVKFGDALIDIETDKVTLEIVAPEDGILAEILKNGGEDVASNELIAHLDTAADVSAASAPPQAPVIAPDGGEQEEPAEQEPPVATATATAAEAAQQSLLPEATSRAQDMEDQQPVDAHMEQTPKLSPAVRSLLREHDLDAGDIPIQGDRLTKKAVLDFLQDKEAQAAADRAAPPVAGETSAPPQQVDTTAAEAITAAAAPSGTAAQDTFSTPEAERPGEEEKRMHTQQPEAPDTTANPPHPGEQRVPMTRLRRRAAERLLAAQRDNAILTTFNEVNMQPVLDLRQRYRDSFEQTHNVKLGFMSFFTKATVEALKKFPLLNAAVDGADIIYHDYFDIGIAVSSARGLVVPVLRAADRLSFAEIEKSISAYGQKAHAGKLTIAELTGGTFTITNGGVFGSLLSTPIINPPQSAILGMHKIEERPVAEDGAVVIRPMMYLALSYDHRIIDGREAVSFLVAVKEALEDPSRLLLQI
ncbi:MAG: 2-oxoglutarate dehydrogenase complex dihydrolipoyllysine-residue succinyltransferase [Gammaproteobacteria bacterium]|nr:2-oxoglutarate dehydrogenase complex dihydrolipoyllysine-residue succinyltransferase [Gammaproteobacteria bacterium]MCY4282032.1 2-oxoglutarate dehydrogenase complex dihydrolipoyllysine-residue succinyltransferase [Gammaproteobacteria bacterium]